jgi:hypothetical protein
MNKALTKVLEKQIGETEAVRRLDPSTSLRAGSAQGRPGSPQAVRLFDGTPLDQARDRQSGRGSPKEQGGDNGP